MTATLNGKKISIRLRDEVVGLHGQKHSQERVFDALVVKNPGKPSKVVKRMYGFRTEQAAKAWALSA